MTRESISKQPSAVAMPTYLTKMHWGFAADSAAVACQVSCLTESVQSAQTEHSTYLYILPISNISVVPLALAAALRSEDPWSRDSGSLVHQGGPLSGTIG